MRCMCPCERFYTVTKQPSKSVVPLIRCPRYLPIQTHVLPLSTHSSYDYSLAHPAPLFLPFSLLAPFPLLPLSFTLSLSLWPISPALCPGCVMETAERPLCGVRPYANHQEGCRVCYVGLPGPYSGQKASKTRREPESPCPR